MKRITLLIAIFVLVTTKSNAQTQLPNRHFEDWSIDSVSEDSLVEWSSSNSTVFSPLVSLSQSTDANAGSYAGQVSTAPFGFAQYSTVGVLVNGKAKFQWGGGGGGANVEYASGGGTPISIKPIELQGYFKKTSSSTNDFGLAIVALTRYNTSTNQRDTVSYGVGYLGNNSNYSPFNVYLDDLMPGTMPDTIVSIFYSSDPNNVEEFGAWSSIYLDDLHLVADPNVGLDEDSKEESACSVYPNPNDGNFHISGVEPGTELYLYNTLGRKVKEILTSSSGNDGWVECGELPSGIYFLSTSENLAKRVKFKIH